VTVVVVDEGEVGVMVFAAPLNRLCYAAGGGDEAVGGVSVGSFDVAVGAVDFGDILGEVESVGVPRAVLLDGEGTSSYGFGGIPGDEPKFVEGGAGEVECRNLKVASVQETMIGNNRVRFFSRLTVCCYGFDFLKDAAPHVIVVGGDDGHGAVGVLAGECQRTVEGVVDGCPDARRGFDAGLVAVRIKCGGERNLVFGDLCVLIESVGGVGEVIGFFLRRLAVADIIVIVGKSLVAHGCSSQFRAIVVRENVLPEPSRSLANKCRFHGEEMRLGLDEEAAIRG
jgi:hypothetical protein